MVKQDLSYLNLWLQVIFKNGGRVLSNKIPNLFIVGVAKAGTTVLANYLSQHPDILCQRLKSLIFF